MSDAGPRDPFTRYRDRLEALGFRPQRRFGQNFLLDQSAHEAVADAGEVAAGDVVLEVGGGLGFLTRVLAARRARVVCAEVDPRLVRILEEDLGELPDGHGSVQIVAGDVLGGDGGSLSAPLVEALTTTLGAAGGGAALRVAANLPYAISGPFLAELLAAPLPQLPRSLALLVQREFADRLAAAPSTAEFGALSALAQTFYTVRRGRSVARGAFRPRPNVDSAIVILSREPGRSEELDAGGRRDFAAMLRIVFAQRRKVLRHGLARLEAERGVHLPASDVERAARAEQLPVARWLELWRGREARTERSAGHSGSREES